MKLVFFWLLVISSGICHETDKRIRPKSSNHASGLTSRRAVISWFPRGGRAPCKIVLNEVTDCGRSFASCWF